MIHIDIGSEAEIKTNDPEPMLGVKPSDIESIVDDKGATDAPPDNTREENGSNEDSSHGHCSDEDDRGDDNSDIDEDDIDEDASDDDISDEEMSDTSDEHGGNTGYSSFRNRCRIDDISRDKRAAQRRTEVIGPRRSDRLSFKRKRVVCSKSRSSSTKGPSSIPTTTRASTNNPVEVGRLATSNLYAFPKRSPERSNAAVFTQYPTA